MNITATNTTITRRVRTNTHAGATRVRPCPLCRRRLPTEKRVRAFDLATGRHILLCGRCAREQATWVQQRKLLTLTAREVEVLGLRLGLRGQQTCTRRQTAQRLHLSPNRIGQIYRNALLKLGRLEVLLSPPERPGEGTGGLPAEDRASERADPRAGSPPPEGVLGAGRQKRCQKTRRFASEEAEQICQVAGSNQHQPLLLRPQGAGKGTTRLHPPTNTQPDDGTGRIQRDDLGASSGDTYLFNALRANGFTRWDQLTTYTARALRDLPRIQKKTLGRLSCVLAERGLRLCEPVGRPRNVDTTLPSQAAIL